MNVPKIATAGLLALSLLGATATFAQTATAEDRVAEAQAFLNSPTSLAQAIAAAEAETGGKVSGIEYQVGENGGPDLILADVVMADGSEKTVALNPADGKVMQVTDEAQDEGQDDEKDGEADDEGENGGENGEADGD